MRPGVYYPHDTPLSMALAATTDREQRSWSLTAPARVIGVVNADAAQAVPVGASPLGSHLLGGLHVGAEQRIDYWPVAWISSTP